MQDAGQREAAEAGAMIVTAVCMVGSVSGQVRARAGERRRGEGMFWMRGRTARPRLRPGRVRQFRGDLREQGVQAGPLGLVQRGEDRLVGGGHRGVEAGDELDAGRRRVDAFTALVAALRAALC